MSSSPTQQLKILWHLVAARVRGSTHEERLESFYKGQADGYDDFRKKMLHGRQEMIRQAAQDCLQHFPDDAVWVDLGAGTGQNAEFLGDDIHRFRKVYLVDLSSSLLEQARRRIADRGWQHVEAVHADATRFTPPEGAAALVTMSYSMTMIPDWFAAVDQAERMLRSGGTFGVADFFVSRKYPAEGLVKHAWATRTFWTLWFASDNVFLNPDHIPYLSRKFDAIDLVQSRGKLPYLPLVRAPYYRFVGRKRPGIPSEEMGIPSS